MLISSMVNNSYGITIALKQCLNATLKDFIITLSTLLRAIHYSVLKKKEKKDNNSNKNRNKTETKW